MGLKSLPFIAPVFVSQYDLSRTSQRAKSNKITRDLNKLQRDQVINYGKAETELFQDYRL